MFEKMSRIDEERGVFEQISLSDFKTWCSITLKTFNNYSLECLECSVLSLLLSFQLI